MSIPSFGDHVVKHESGGRQVQLSCRYIAPGLTFMNLMEIFDEAEAKAEPGDHLRGDPSKWPNHRGVFAVAGALLKAIYETTV